MTTPPPADIAGHLIGSGSLLRRDDEGCFFFVHQSVMEWLVAREAAETVRRGFAHVALDMRAFSPLMAEFFCDLLGKELAEKWAKNELACPLVSRSTVKTNALEVLKRLGVQATLNLAGQDLRGKDFEEQSLVGAGLTGADLTEARLVGKDLTGAKLDGAILIRADLTKAILTNASLDKANLSEARLLGADLQGARLAGASLRRAKLIGAQRSAPFETDCDLWGAALPGERLALPMLLAASPCRCAAWSPDGCLLATGHDNGLVALWEPASGKLLRTLEGHQAGGNRRLRSRLASSQCDASRAAPDGRVQPRNSSGPSAPTPVRGT